MAKGISHDRNWCSELVAVVHMNRRGAPERVSANLEEIGECSALLVSESPLPIASRLHIACRKHVLRGITTSCEFDEPLGYVIEIELAPASRWSRRWFSPRHLILRRDIQLRLSA